MLTTTTILFFAYMAWIVMIEKEPHSISDSFYVLNKKKKGLGYVFTLWTFVMAIMIMSQIFERTDGMWYQFLGLFAGGGLAFVGAAPAFRGHEKAVHTVSAVVCAVAGLGWMILSGYWYIPLIMGAISAIYAVRVRNWLYSGEMALFVSAIVVLYITK